MTTSTALAVYDPAHAQRVAMIELYGRLYRTAQAKKRKPKPVRKLSTPPIITLEAWSHSTRRERREQKVAAIDLDALQNKPPSEYTADDYAAVMRALRRRKHEQPAVAPTGVIVLADTDTSAAESIHDALAASSCLDDRIAAADRAAIDITRAKLSRLDPERFASVFYAKSTP